MSEDQALFQIVYTVQNCLIVIGIKRFREFPTKALQVVVLKNGAFINMVLFSYIGRKYKNEF